MYNIRYCIIKCIVQIKVGKNLKSWKFLSIKNNFKFYYKLSKPKIKI